MTLDAIKLDGIKISFGHNLLLNNISCSFENRSFHMILGHNGVGKTTLLKIIAEVLLPSDGFVVNPWSKSIFYLEDIPSIFDKASVSDFINFIKLSYTKNDHPNVNFILKGLFSKRVNSLSTGERKKVILAAAMISNAKLILFDEPTNGLDSEFKKKLYKIFNHFEETGACVVFTTHLVNDFHGIGVEKYILQDKSLLKLRKLNESKYIIRLEGIDEKKLMSLFNLKHEPTEIIEKTDGEIEATITLINEMESLNDYLGILIKNNIKIESVQRL